jgi:hypothetical protein
MEMLIAITAGSSFVIAMFLGIAIFLLRHRGDEKEEESPPSSPYTPEPTSSDWGMSQDYQSLAHERAILVNDKFSTAVEESAGSFTGSDEKEPEMEDGGLYI